MLVSATATPSTPRIEPGAASARMRLWAFGPTDPEVPALAAGPLCHQHPTAAVVDAADECLVVFCGRDGYARWADLVGVDVAAPVTGMGCHVVARVPGRDVALGERAAKGRWR